MSDSTFVGVVADVLYRVEEDIDDIEDDVLQIVKNGINEGYMLISSQVDKRTTDITFDYVDGYTLPVDFVEAVNISHSTIGRLSVLDYEIIADILYITSTDAKSGKITMKYVHYPSALSNDTDVVQLKSKYLYALLVYGAYIYYVYKRKTDAATMFLNEFDRLIGGNKINET